MGTLRFFEEVVSFKIRRTFGFADYIWQSTKQRHWFGPTKAEVSLIWLIGRGNYNEKKGGKR